MLHTSLLTRFAIFISLILLSFTFQGCNPDEEVPGYIHINKITLTTDYTKEGTDRANIVDAWVYVDGLLQGVYKLPATFPVLKSGQHHVRISAGVIIDGVESARRPYDFFAPYEQDIVLNPNLVTTINPTVQYYNDVNTNNDGSVFPWLLDFETGLSLDSSTASTVNIHTVSDPALVYEGAKSGVIKLDADHRFANIISHDSFALPKGGASVYLELNYNTNSFFYIGLRNEEGIELVVLGLRDTKDTWKKLYLNLTPYTSSDANSQKFQVFFQSTQSDSTASKPAIYLDNIKLLHAKS